MAAEARQVKSAADRAELLSKGLAAPGQPSIEAAFAPRADGAPDPDAAARTAAPSPTHQVRPRVVPGVELPEPTGRDEPEGNGRDSRDRSPRRLAPGNEPVPASGSEAGSMQG